MADIMRFWGVNVSAKEPCQVSLEQGSVIHVSQITLGESKKDNEPVTVHVKVDDKKFVVAMLSQNTPRLSSDLVFDEDFEISHNWKNGSIHLLGYQAVMAKPESDLDSSDDEEEDLPVAKENGQLALPAAKAPVVKPKEDNKPEEKAESDEDDSSDEEGDDDEEDSDDDEEMGMSDSDGDEDDSDDSEEETPAKADAGKKRPNADAKTPQSKKAKLATPQKTDDKKGPQPKKPEVPCGSCKKTFKTEAAMQAHTKAKHADK